MIKIITDSSADLPKEFIEKYETYNCFINGHH